MISSNKTENASPLILASASPRRQDLLNRVVLEFQIVPAEVDEETLTANHLELSPEELAMLLSREKALAVSRHYPEAVVLGADTLVVLQGKVLGKPADFNAAVAMLESEQGKTQSVLTGLAVVCNQQILAQEVVTSRVAMRALTRAEIVRYVETGQAYDKAGGYGIQEEARDFVAWYEGCFFNIVGLPLCAVAELMRQSPVAHLILEPLELPPECLNTGRVYLRKL